MLPLPQIAADSWGWDSQNTQKRGRPSPLCNTQLVTKLRPRSKRHFHLSFQIPWLFWLTTQIGRLGTSPGRPWLDTCSSSLLIHSDFFCSIQFCCVFWFQNKKIIFFNFIPFKPFVVWISFWPIRRLREWVPFFRWVRETGCSSLRSFLLDIIFWLVWRKVWKTTAFCRKRRLYWWNWVWNRCCCKLRCSEGWLGLFYFKLKVSQGCDILWINHWL